MNKTQPLFAVNNRPFFPLGGQFHNSSAYNLSEMEAGLRALSALQANTAEIPVYWEQIEAQEGQFDFRIIDDLLDVARLRGLKLVLLWFATWKNGMMKYAPAWVKDAPERFHRVITADGTKLAVLSAHCRATWEADCRAYCELVEYLKQRDSEARTVIAIQVENEPGSLGSDRDYSEEAEKLFQAPVPGELVSMLNGAPGSYAARIWRQHNAPVGGSWPDLFGADAGEFFSAWHIARYIDGIAEAGKRILNVPMYVNVWLQEYQWRVAGASYPSGGATTNVIDIWKAAAPHLDLIAPDIYILNAADYVSVCKSYARPDNPLFIPESARHLSNATNLFYAVGDWAAVGYAVFGVESLVTSNGEVRPEMAPLVESFACVRAALPLLIKYRGTGKIRTIAEEEYRTEQYFDLGAYTGLVVFGSGGGTPAWTDFRHGFAESSGPGRGLLIQVDERELYLVGSGFRLGVKKKEAPERMLSSASASDFLFTRLANYRRVEEGHFDSEDNWIVDRLRNGDESDFGIWVRPDVGVVRVVLGD